MNVKKKRTKINQNCLDGGGVEAAAIAEPSIPVGSVSARHSSKTVAFALIYIHNDDNFLTATIRDLK